jgi:hypothetical protein
MLPHALASADSLSTFIRVLTRPEPGTYYGDASVPAGNYASVPEFVDPTQHLKPLFNIAVGSGEGRYLHNDYDYSKGYNWGDYQTQVGSAYEKQFAIYYLMEAYNHFIQNSKQDYLDSRILNINYATLYGEQMRRIMAQLMQDNPMTMGPYVATTAGSSATAQIARVQYLPWDKWDGSGAVNYPTGTTVLNPLVGWEQQYPALINGFYFGGTTLSMDWVDQMRILSPGGAETISWAANQQIHYTDPFTGVQYIARDYGTESVGGLTTQRGSGARMLQYAKDLAMASYKYTLDANNDPVWALDANKQPVCTLDTTDACGVAATNIRRYSANIDSLRELGQFLGAGPLNRF